MRRPIGVVLVSIVLGLVAVVLLFMAFGTLALLAVPPQAPATPGVAPPSPALMRAFTAVFASFYLALAAWAVTTLVGLVRMKPWARISSMVIAGGLLLIGILGAVMMLFVQTMMASYSPTAAENPMVFRAIMIAAALFWLFIAGIGVWWLVYFALRRTREAFRLAAEPPGLAFRASTYPATSMQTEPVDLVPAIPARPLPISIIGWLYLVAAVLTIPTVFLPFPLFIFGFIISGWAAHATALCIGVVAALVGFGLLRLQKFAFFAACALNILGIAHTLILVVPSYRERMIAYQQTLIQQMTTGMPAAPGFDNRLMAVMMIPGILLALAFCITLLVLLIRNRSAFDPGALPQAAE